MRYFGARFGRAHGRAELFEHGSVIILVRKELTAHSAGGPLDALIHCGDGGSDAKCLAGNILQTVIVRGNCDGWGCDYEDDMLVNIGGVNIFVTHGHRYGVKSGLDTLASAAAAKGAQVACFGHTHKPFCEYRDGVLLINPGTCTLRGACALLTIDQSGSFQAELL